MSHFSPICPPFLHHFPPFFILVGTVSYIFHDVFVTTSHFPPFFSISPHFPPFSPIFPHFPPFSRIFPRFPHFPHFSVACWILGYSGYGYFLGLWGVLRGVTGKLIYRRGAAPALRRNAPLVQLPGQAAAPRKIGCTKTGSKKRRTRRINTTQSPLHCFCVCPWPPCAGVCQSGLGGDGPPSPSTAPLVT